ncbi:hypothetical protein [Pseudorhodoferax sp.]|uniref:hypothetical protein n=1 Tax=Pseudorhodoferax sp. TaxID=1993553 RepID=UPI0039E6EC01
MANMCTISRPSVFSPQQWQSTTASYSNGGFTNPYGFFQQSRNADVSGGSFYFDADKFGMTCVAFPDASGNEDPLIGQAAAIQALQSATVGLQNQISAMAPWVGENAADAQAERIQDMSDVWALFFGAAIVIACWKGLQRLFDRGPNDD